MKGRVLENIHISVETKVLRIVRSKEDMETRITINLHSIHDIISIEPYGIIRNRRCHGTAK